MTRRPGFLLAIMAAALLGACADGPTTSAAALRPGMAPLLSSSPHARVIPDRYLVMFRDDAADPAGLAARLVAAHGGGLHHTYRYAIKGFAATLPASAVEALRRNPNVAFMEHDQAATPAAVQSPTPNWGVDRIDQPNLPLNNTFTYTYTGANVRAYVIDSGIDVSHDEFGVGSSKRASLGYDVCYGGCLADDSLGHGTKVAGFIGATTYGVAKGVSLISVRVYKSGTTGELATASTIAAGVDWVTQQKVAMNALPEASRIPMVANISSVLARDSLLNTAIRNSIKAGVTYVIGAGNANGDACNYSPSSVTEAIVVGAIDRADERSSFSNYGPCVDLYAPGQQLTTTNKNGGIATTQQGTSYAAPHVAGMVAMYLQKFPGSSPADVQSAVIYHSTKNVILGLPGTTSNNRLLYTNFESQSGRPPGCC